MAKRGFWAELQHQQQVAAKRQAQAQRSWERERAAAQRRAEQARRQAERARQQQERRSAAEQKAAEKEARRLHDEARVAEAESRNAQLAHTAGELESLLSASLSVEHTVDLGSLRQTPVHRPFSQPELERVTPRPEAPPASPEPVLVEPDAPTGLRALGGQKRHQKAVEAANTAFAEAYRVWQAEEQERQAEEQRRLQSWEAAEHRRQDRLRAARAVYSRKCQTEDAEAEQANQRLDELMKGIRQGAPSAVQDYVSIVLGNSVYPEILSVEHEFAFDAESNELELAVLIAPPSELPGEKLFRYVKARDEITSTPLPQKDVRARYASVVEQVALRTLYEVFQADWARHIVTIALKVATDAIDPATGRLKQTTLLAVGAERRAFLGFDLGQVVPASTLKHMGAATSKNPAELVGIDEAPGVRTR